MTALTYRYVAVAADGRHRRGTVQAPDEASAVRSLTSRGLAPVEVARSGGVSSRRRGGRVTRADVAAVTRELSVLVSARVPIAQGLAAMAQQERNAALASVLRSVATALESGAAFSDAVAAHRRVFGEVYVASLRAAEKTGRLAEILADLARMIDRELSGRRTLVRALTYPSIVMAVIAVALVVLIGFVVPRFAESFAGGAASLPLLTRLLAGLGASMAESWYLYAGVAGAVAGGAWAAWRSPVGRRRIESALPRVPVVGPIVVAVTTARFARVLGLALGSGLDLVESVRLAGRSTGNSAFSVRTDGVVASIAGGDTLQAMLRRTSLLPGFATRLMSAGNDAAELSRACAVVADHYDEQAEHLTKGLTTVIEPALTLVMAVVVLVVALSVFQPMWQAVRVAR